MRLFVSLPVPLAEAVVAAAERNRRRPGDELVMLAEAELTRRGLIGRLDPVPVLAAPAPEPR